MTFSHHTSCPNCGSRDNRGVWEDGHTFCFGCGYKTFENSRLEDVQRLVKEKFSNKDISLPDDFMYAIPAAPLSWLKKYSLTNEEIQNNRIGYSYSQQMLIFPFWEGDHLIMWQGRFFPQRVPKNFTVGYPENHIIIKGDQRSSVVIVEDAVSQIKVARHCACCCLFGAHLSLHKAIGLSRVFENLILWLDNDKIKEMIKFKERYAHLFKTVKIIISDTDPKEQTDVQIINHLTND